MHLTFYVKVLGRSKKNKGAYLNGSMLFLQLFYFNLVVHSGVYVDKSLHHIVSWDNNLACK